MPRQHRTAAELAPLVRDMRVEAPGGGIPLTSALPRGIAILFPRQVLAKRTAGAFFLQPDGACSDIPPCPQADFPASTHDDVVMQGKTQRFAALLDLLRHLQVRIRRLRITAGVIVDEDQRRRVHQKRSFQNLTRIDRHMVDRTDRDPNIGNQPVFPVQVEYVKALDLAAHSQRIMPKSA